MESETSTRPRFPALDPEPPPRRWWRALPVLVLVAVVGVTVIVVTTRSPHRQHSPRPLAGSFAGIVLAEAPSGQLTLTDLRSGRTVRLSSLGLFPVSPAPVVSADGKYLIAPAMGILISLANPAVPVKVPNSLSFSTTSDPALASPFADHDRSVVLQGLTYSLPVAKAPTSIQSVSTGHTVPLGIADLAAGDPQAPGVFAPVGWPSLPLHDGVTPDVRLELRDAGAPPRVLASSASLRHILGISARATVTLRAIPNPQGTMVAVEVQPTSPGSSAGVVVLDRRGKVLGFESTGSPAIPAIAWSLSGTTLAFVGSGAIGPELTEWDVGAQSSTVNLPFGMSTPAGCMWSPDATAVLCGTSHGAWTILSAGVPHRVTGRGLALAWLSGRLGR
ncbi:MAG TPA: hypothetical protein VF834_17130 [Streptosporangiaceae bacterium]